MDNGRNVVQIVVQKIDGIAILEEDDDLVNQDIAWRLTTISSPTQQPSQISFKPIIFLSFTA